MKFLFLPYACAEKFRAAKTGAINVPLSPEASMAEFYVAKREDAMKFLEFFCKRAERGLEILKFLSARHFGLQGAAVKRRSEILKFSAAERLKRRFESQNQAAELLNSSSLSPRKFKLALLKFPPEPPRNRSEILKFTLARRKFKLVPCKSKSEPRKFEPAPAVRLNFALNSAPQARAAKFENGVKFKGAAKFERGAR
ncbi:hypothetical protein [uncultured Campylobacter sp.]|uniref:hypothetical protein n=1 Tax=uncultured Campylobacter sp. TaxID=218934 RepID=UPI0026033CEF|nr:hypothetical protein [uncultured Campylobacter sp.]